MCVLGCALRVRVLIIRTDNALFCWLRLSLPAVVHFLSDRFVFTSILGRYTVGVFSKPDLFNTIDLNVVKRYSIEK
nr:MAG TPA: hypothetical protein [Caudoviricetes sp.]